MAALSGGGDAFRCVLSAEVFFFSNTKLLFKEERKARLDLTGGLDLTRIQNKYTPSGLEKSRTIASVERNVALCRMI